MNTSCRKILPSCPRACPCPCPNCKRQLIATKFPKFILYQSLRTFSGTGTHAGTGTQIGCTYPEFSLMCMGWDVKNAHFTKATYVLQGLFSALYDRKFQVRSHAYACLSCNFTFIQIGFSKDLSFCLFQQI